MIERLYIHNFRCFENFTLDLKGCPSALVIGKNGAGKSTLLHCLGLFQAICRGTNRADELISYSDFAQHRSERPIRFEVDVLLSGKKFKYAISFERIPKFQQVQVLDEILSVDGRTVFVRNQSVVRLRAANIEAAKVENPTEPEALPLNDGIWVGVGSSTIALPILEDPKDSTIRDVKQFFSTMFVLSPIPANMTGFAESPTPFLQKDAANFAACLRWLLGQKPAAYSVFESYVKEAISDFSSIENVERGENGTQLIVKFAQHAPPRNFSIKFKSLSDGEKCFFLSAYIIASNKVGPPVVCIWDEPDNHLSLPAVGQFITSLRKMTNHTGQFIATTHHPEAIRKFSDETTLVLTRKSHLDPTVVRPLTDFPHKGDLINALIRDEIIG